MNEENKNRCPNCGYMMQNLYIQSVNSSGKRTWKTIGSKFCNACKIEKSIPEIRIVWILTKFMPVDHV